MKKTFLFASSVVLAVFTSGCSTDDGGSGSPYRDPEEMRGRDTGFTTYDVQQCATALIDSLLGDDDLDATIKTQFQGKRPRVAVVLHNLTYQLSATDKLKKSMLSTIESRLNKSKRFKFVDRRAMKLLVDDTLDEMNGVTVRDGGAAALKNADGVDYILVGELEEFREGDGRVHDTYYKMTAKLLNKHTKETDWIGEKEIRKVSKRPFVGW